MRFRVSSFSGVLPSVKRLHLFPRLFPQSQHQVLLSLLSTCTVQFTFFFPLSLPPSLPPSLSLASLALSCPVIICSGQFIFTSLSIPPLLPCLFLSAHLWPLHPFFYPWLTFQASLPLTAKSDPCENQSFFPDHNPSLSFPSFLSAWGLEEKSHFQTGQKAGERRDTKEIRFQGRPPLPISQPPSTHISVPSEALSFSSSSWVKQGKASAWTGTTRGDNISLRVFLFII